MRAITVKQALGLSIALHGVLMVIIFFKLHHPMHSKTFAVEKQITIIKAALYSVQPKPIVTHAGNILHRAKPIIQKAAIAKLNVKSTARQEKLQPALMKNGGRHQQIAQKLRHGNLQDKVLKTMFSQILAHRYYPILAKRRHHQGKVLLNLVLDQNGRISRLRITQSSGYRELDNAAMTAVNKAQPFKDTKLLAGKSIVIPMKYSLNG